MRQSLNQQILDALLRIETLLTSINAKGSPVAHIEITSDPYAATKPYVRPSTTWGG